MKLKQPVRKEHCESKCKELENKLLYAEVYQRQENLRFYGIEETEQDENSLKVLQSLLERQCGIEPGIEFQRVHRIRKPRGDGSPRAIIARFLRYGDRELIFAKANKLKDTEYRISADLPKEIVIEGNYSQRSWWKQGKLVRQPFSTALNLINYLLIES